MQPIFMQFSEAETAIIALLSIMTILLVILVLRFNKKFSELYYKTDEQSRHFHAQQENFQRTRAALLEAQANTQFKMEQRFGEVQHALEKSQRFLASELVREQLFRQLGQELPYATAVEITRFDVEDEDFLSMDMTIWVDRDGQKGIIVGKKGVKLKEIGTRAREQMQLLFGKRVHVSLWVKVRKGWADNTRMLKSLGYTE